MVHRILLDETQLGQQKTQDETIWGIKNIGKHKGWFMAM